jgi:voltage-gated potassium channel
MTTVGYGDVPVKTDLGRVIAIAVMLVAIGFVAILTAALAERFVATQVRAETVEIVEEVEYAEADVLRELREITGRLQQLETHVGRMRPS